MMDGIVTKSNISILNLSILVALAKGFSVFYFVLLPLFYAQGVITASALGYIGSLFIGMVIIGAMLVAKWLHTWNLKSLLTTASVIGCVSTVMLLFAVQARIPVLMISAYALMGVASGVSLSGINVLISESTTRGDRFKTMAQLTMLTDVVRIVFPLFVAGFVVLEAYKLSIVLILFTNVLFLILAVKIKHNSHHTETDTIDKQDVERAIHNKLFRFILSLEFFDSFASSQLVIFIPLLFLAKGYALQSTLILQTFVFLGYLSGRWLVSYLARRLTGFKAITIAELGMVITILLLLFVRQFEILFLLSFSLGIFTRGTSPAIKALAFDSLADHQVKQGSALHVLAGDSGSALSQLLFGLSIAWFGVTTPFVLGAVIALGVAISTFTKNDKYATSPLTS